MPGIRLHSGIGAYDAIVIRVLSLATVESQKFFIQNEDAIVIEPRPFSYILSIPDTFVDVHLEKFMVRKRACIVKQIDYP